ncbi:MAG TPA: TIGR01777 family oxidoreductase [Fibrobacteria bacterium]|nr:TIGR01777 family oxidoreductase [Fibrobacteria bacterium]HOX53215.1 TIGR01777 family oxidoreductase [Fibrobacteria bacterium]
MDTKRIAVAGSSGLIASRTIPYLEAAGWKVLRLVRRPARHGGERTWDPRAAMSPGLLEGCGAVLNLCGHSISDWPWTRSTRRAIRTSRVETTSALARVARQSGVGVFINGSAMGFYGNRGDLHVPETTAGGGGFLAEVCRDWEEALSPLQGSATRVVALRTGIVLSSRGGSLPPQWNAWRRGLGAILGSGEQWIPWIHLEDAARAIVHVLEDHGSHGAVNLCSPTPVRQREFSKSLDSLSGSTTRLKVPAWLLAGLLGDFARELLLSGQRGVPELLSGSGFSWNHPDLRDALEGIRSELSQ